MFRCTFFALTIFLASLCTASGQEQRSYELGTATTGGTYYPVGVAIEALAKALLRDTYNLEIHARPTGGSIANLELLADDDIQFAMVQGIYTHSGITEDAAFTETATLAEFRSVTMLWPDVFHLLIQADLAATGTVHDLQQIGDAQIALGRSDSGARLSSRTVLAALGIDSAQMNVVDVGGYDAIASAFENNRIAAGSLLGGVPMSAISRTLSADEERLTLLSFSDEDVTAVNEGHGALWIRYVVPAGTYPGQTEDLATIAEPNALLVRADVAEDDVYLLTKVIFENLTFLGNMHPAALQITKERALVGMAVPLHPGAARYFDEIGLAIPEPLRTPAE